jgi:hypothetical protein
VPRTCSTAKVVWFYFRGRVFLERRRVLEACFKWRRVLEACLIMEACFGGVFNYGGVFGGAFGGVFWSRVYNVGLRRI